MTLLLIVVVLNILIIHLVIRMSQGGSELLSPTLLRFFLPLPPPPTLRNSDRCIRRPSYEAQSAFPRARTSPLCPRPCHVLSLESNGEFLLARTVGVDDRAGELVVRAA